MITDRFKTDLFIGVDTDHRAVGIAAPCQRQPIGKPAVFLTQNNGQHGMRRRCFVPGAAYAAIADVVEEAAQFGQEDHFRPRSGRFGQLVGILTDP